MEENVIVNVFHDKLNKRYPSYSHHGDSGQDVFMNLELTKENLSNNLGWGWYKNHDENGEDYIEIEPGGNALIATGMKVAIPYGYEIQIRSKSGMALNGIQSSNSPGTVDHLYRGDIGVILHNFSPKPYILRDGDKVAQIVLCKVERIEWHHVESVDELGNTTRGEGAYGSTGK